VAGLCLWRFVRCHCDSDGAGLAGFIASAVTERSTEGKAASSRNAFKGGWRAELRRMSALLRDQWDGLKRIGY
jgi:hypothetical protein